jgi:hypothetical protein
LPGIISYKTDNSGGLFSIVRGVRTVDFMARVMILLNSVKSCKYYRSAHFANS